MDKRKQETVISIVVSKREVIKMRFDLRKTVRMQFESHKIVGFRIYLSVVIGRVHKIRVRH